MNLFTHPEFDRHEAVHFFHDHTSGLKAIIAIHNTHRGPALGGCRMWPYASDEEALRDVLRLSKGMTYKSALAELPLGGGKSVIIGNPRTDKSEALLRAMGRFLDRLGGHYIAAEDSGTSVTDLKVMGLETDHVAGVQARTGLLGEACSGDPSPATAYGTFVGIQAAVKHRFGRDDLSGLKVAVQGVGNVGFRLARYLHDAGAELYVSDIFPEQLARARDELGATVVDSDQIIGLDVDLFAPCALGAVINDESLTQLRAPIIAGAANNQLAHPYHGDLLHKQGILYAPDFVINAGGIIDVCYERTGYEPAKVRAHVERIGRTLSEVFQRADASNRPTALIANQLAEERFMRPTR